VIAPGASPGETNYKNVVKIAIFGLTQHRITRKLLKIDRYMLRGVWQALNCLSIHETGATITQYPQEKMWARYVKTAIFFSLAV